MTNKHVEVMSVERSNITLPRHNNLFIDEAGMIDYLEVNAII